MNSVSSRRLRAKKITPKPIATMKAPMPPTRATREPVTGSELSAGGGGGAVGSEGAGVGLSEIDGDGEGGGVQDSGATQV